MPNSQTGGIKISAHKHYGSPAPRWRESSYPGLLPRLRSNLDRRLQRCGFFSRDEPLAFLIRGPGREKFGQQDAA